MNEPDYTRMTYDLTLAAARAMVAANPRMTFCYVSGVGTDSTERGRTMWARVKGRTENALLALPFAAAYMFRPGYIQPVGGVRSKTAWVQAALTVVGSTKSRVRDGRRIARRWRRQRARRSEGGGALVQRRVECAAECRRSPGHDHDVEDERQEAGLDDRDLMRPCDNFEMVVVPLEVVDATGIDAIDEYTRPPWLHVQLQAAGGTVGERHAHALDIDRQRSPSPEDREHGKRQSTKRQSPARHERPRPKRCRIPEG